MVNFLQEQKESSKIKRTENGLDKYFSFLDEEKENKDSKKEKPFFSSIEVAGCMSSSSGGTDILC